MGSQRVTPINQKESDRKSSTNATSQRSPNLLGHWVEGDRFQADSHPYQQAPGQDAFHSSQTRPLFRGLSHELQADAASSGMQVQAKMTIGAPGDRYEQEADRVAAQVVNQINAPQSSQQGATLQRQKTNEGDDNLQMKPLLQSPSESIPATPELEAEIGRSRSSGQPLAENIRSPMERAFGTDFSGVRVHANTQSDQLNQSIQAKAFTTGENIFFRRGEYQPGSRGGQELIAHELTHVMQQAQTNRFGVSAAGPNKIMRMVDYKETQERLKKIAVSAALVRIDLSHESENIRDTVNDFVKNAKLQYTTTFFHANESGLLPAPEWASRNLSPLIEFNVAKVSGMTRVVYDVRGAGTVYICPHYDGYIAVDNIGDDAKNHLQKVACENIGYVLLDYGVDAPPITAEQALNDLKRYRDAENQQQVLLAQLQ